jgi:multicomponent Na+:H+ antiporter subunit B
MFSIFLLFRGHHLPGGGFIGGLVAASAFILLAMSFPMDKTRDILRVNPLLLVGTGLLVSMLSGLPAVLHGKPFLTGVWYHPKLFGTSIPIGTPLIFDLGVYLLVIGFTLVVVLTFEEHQ